MLLKDILLRDMDAGEALAQASARMSAHIEAKGGSPRKVAELLRKHFPDSVEAVMRQADEAMHCMLVLPGTGAKPAFVGDPPRWNDNPFNDNEYVWSLTRMRFLLPLLNAAIYTGDDAYCDKAIAMMTHYVDTVPRPSIEFLQTKGHGGSPVSGWRTLEVGIRMFDSWAYAMRFLLMENKLTPAQYEKLLISIYEHGETLAKVPIVYWPDAGHNHYLMENLGLLTLALYYPELACAQAWRDQAMRELERCSSAQLTDDGGQIEGCPGYHNGCMYWFYQAAARAESFGLRFSDAYMARLRRGFDYALFCHMPNGDIAMWGDSTQSEHGLFTAMLCQLLYGDAQSVDILTAYAGEAEMRQALCDMGWDIDSERDIARLLEARKPADAQMPPLYSLQRGLDQFIARSSWSPEASFLFFGCRLPVNNAHAHIDTAGYEFAAYGEKLIIDPGDFCYREDDQRRKYKSAQWHSTLLINEKPPFEFVSSWSFTPQKPGCITCAGEQDGVYFAEGMHSSYEPILHRRLVALMGTQALVVLDRVEHLSPADRVSLYVHLDSVNVTSQAAGAFTSVHGGAVMTSAFWHATGEVLEGTISEYFDIERPSKRLHLLGGATGETQVYASVFVPRKGDAPAQVSITGCQYTLARADVALLVDGKPVRLALDLPER